MSETTETMKAEAPKEKPEAKPDTPDVKPGPFITMMQANNNRPLLEAKRLLIYRVGDKRWLADEMGGYDKTFKELTWSPDYSKACRWTFAQFTNWIYHHDTGYLLELVDKKLAEEIRSQKRPITSLFSENEIKLIKAAPTNPAVRAMIGRSFKLQPPDSVKTYPELKEWLESTPNNKIAATTLVTAEEILAGATNQAQAATSFRVRITLDDEQYGNGNYTQRRRGTTTRELTAAQIMEEATNAIASGGNWGSFRDRVHWLATNADAWSLGPEMEWHGSPIVHDREIIRTTHMSVSTSRIELDGYLRKWCKDNMTSEQQRRIGLE